MAEPEPLLTNRGIIHDETNFSWFPKEKVSPALDYVSIGSIHLQFDIDHRTGVD